MEQAPKSLLGLGVRMGLARTAVGYPPISQAQLPPLPETSPCTGGPRAPPGQAPTPSTHPGATWALTRGPRSPGCQPPTSASAGSPRSPGCTRLRSRPGEGVAESPALSTGLQTPGQMVQPSLYHGGSLVQAAGKTVGSLPGTTPSPGQGPGAEPWPHFQQPLPPGPSHGHHIHPH